MIAFKITQLFAKIPNFSIKLLAPLWTRSDHTDHKRHWVLTDWSATRTSQIQLINDKTTPLFLYSTSNNNSRPAPGSGDGGGDGSNSISSIVYLVVDILVLVVKFWFTIIESIVQLFIPRPEMDVSGRSVLITGAGHGIGKQLALQYAKLGARVICWDINEENNQKTVEEIKKSGGCAFGYVCNVTKREDVMELARRNRQEHGFISIVINNAGIMPTHPLLDHKEQETRLLFDINVLANFWVSLVNYSGAYGKANYVPFHLLLAQQVLQAFLPEMIERNEGNIVALSSCAGLFGLKNLVPYCGTKFAVRGYMTALAEELRSKNPQTNVSREIVSSKRI